MQNRTLQIIGGVVAVVLILLVVLGITSIVQNWESVNAWLTAASDPTQIIPCSESATCSVVHPIVYGLILVLLIITGFAYTPLLERRILAFLQQRVGPNRAGPLGLFQPVADAVKLIFKEDIIPDNADKPVYYLAPMLKAIPVLIIVAVIPLGPPIVFPGLDGSWYQIPLGLSDVNVGVLWILGITSLGTYGMVLAGWSSNNKYAALGGIRASAQMISYELSMGLTLAVPVMLASSMSVGDIIETQRNVWDWFVFQNPLAAGIFLIAMFAEVARAPFDIPEAEQELTAGYMTEYSGMKFAMFMMAEYIGILIVSMISVAMFFGGYNLVPVDNVPLLAPLFFIGKIVLFASFFIWVRGTLPRLRYDRLMALGWKVLLPLSLVAVAWTAIAVVLRDATSPTVYGAVSAIFFLVVVVGGFFILREEQPEDVQPDDELANDPLITGDRSGIAWTLINLIGGLIAIPFMIVNGIINGLESFGKAAAGSDKSAIVPTDQSQGGD